MTLWMTHGRTTTRLQKDCREVFWLRWVLLFYCFNFRQRINFRLTWIETFGKIMLWIDVYQNSMFYCILVSWKLFLQAPVKLLTTSSSRSSRSSSSSWLEPPWGGSEGCLCLSACVCTCLASLSFCRALSKCKNS